MKVDAELVFGGIFPALVGLLLLTLSLRSSFKRKSIVSWMFTLIIIAIIGIAEIMFYNIIFTDAYPSFLPHLLLVASFFLFGAQLFSKTS